MSYTPTYPSSREAWQLTKEPYEQVDAPKLLEAWKHLFLKAPWDPTHKVELSIPAICEHALSTPWPLELPHYKVPPCLSGLPKAILVDTSRSATAWFYLLSSVASRGSCVYLLVSHWASRTWHYKWLHLSLKQLSEERPSAPRVQWDWPLDNGWQRPLEGASASLSGLRHPHTAPAGPQQVSLH